MVSLVEPLKLPLSERDNRPGYARLRAVKGGVSDFFTGLRLRLLSLALCEHFVEQYS